MYTIYDKNYQVLKSGLSVDELLAFCDSLDQFDRRRMHLAHSNIETRIVLSHWLAARKFNKEVARTEKEERNG